MGEGAVVRNIYAWPFSYDSIWNLPLSTSAQYEVVDLAPDPSLNWGMAINLDLEDISMDPALPIKNISANGTIISAHVDTALEGNPDVAGNWNNCASFLATDNINIHQGQPLNYPAGGTPYYQYVWPLVNLKSTGITGCHGGSSLSGLGGDLRKGEMTSSEPIRHSLKMTIDCVIYCSRTGNGGLGYTWPATTADYNYNVAGSENYYDRFGNANQYVLSGALLALPTDFNLASLNSLNAKKIARALMLYGAYIVDNSAVSENNPTATRGLHGVSVQRGAESEFADPGCPSPFAATSPPSTCQFYTDLKTIQANLRVVKNNTASTPGGDALGSSRLAPYAPAFLDGTGAPPSVTVVPPPGT